MLNVNFIFPFFDTIQYKIFNKYKNSNTGRHCCLWCEIPSSELVKLNATRSNNLRTLQSLKNYLERFEEFDKAPIKAKECNYVIDQIFFDIPLDRVSLLLN